MVIPLLYCSYLVHFDSKTSKETSGIVVIHDESKCQNALDQIAASSTGTDVNSSTVGEFQTSNYKYRYWPFQTLK